MALSLRAPLVESNGTVLIKVAHDEFGDSMTKWIDQFFETKNLAQHRELLICDYTEKEDCLCEGLFFYRGSTN